MTQRRIQMAVYPVAPGNPDYSTGSSSQYIPAIYSALLVKKFYPKTVFGQISNTDYQGNIKDQGDTVFIRTRPTIETFDYKKGMVLPVQNPESPYLTLKIDQGTGFSFALDRVDEFQADIKLMNVWGEDAAEQMKQVIDRNLLISIAAQGAYGAGTSKAKTTVTGYVAGKGADLSGFTAANGALLGGGSTVKGTTITAGTLVTNLALSDAAYAATDGGKITDKILQFGRFLNENNAPTEGRFVIVPFWVEQFLKTMSSSNLFGQAYATGQNSANILTGKVPTIDGFEIIGSNNLPTTTEANGSAVIFGCKYATTFATQITESEILSNPFAYGKMMRGLQVYGMQVIKPQLLGVDFWKSA
jgi:hypothetical protein